MAEQPPSPEIPSEGETREAHNATKAAFLQKALRVLARREDAPQEKILFRRVDLSEGKAAVIDLHTDAFWGAATKPEDVILRVRILQKLANREHQVIGYFLKRQGTLRQYTYVWPTATQVADEELLSEALNRMEESELRAQEMGHDIVTDAELTELNVLLDKIIETDLRSGA